MTVEMFCRAITEESELPIILVVCFSSNQTANIDGSVSKVLYDPDDGWDRDVVSKYYDSHIDIEILEDEIDLIVWKAD